MSTEYKIIDTKTDGNPDDEYELNELAKEGWNLVCVKPIFDGSERYYFRRFSIENDRELMLRGLCLELSVGLQMINAEIKELWRKGSVVSDLMLIRDEIEKSLNSLTSLLLFDD
jgi:hypothetical protein